MKPALTILGVAMGIFPIGPAQASPSEPSTNQFTCPTTSVGGQEVRLSGTVAVTKRSETGGFYLEVRTLGNLPELNMKETAELSAAQGARTLSLRFIPKNYDEDAFVNVTLVGGISQIGVSPVHVIAHDWEGPKNDSVRQLVDADCAYTGESPK